MATTAQLKAQAKYDKNNTKQIILKLNLTSDLDIISKLSDLNNKQGYIKELIRNDMKGSSSILSIDSIRYLLLPVIKKYKIKSVTLFGSYARNEATDTSDIDLIIDGGDYSGLGYIKMINEMEKALGKKVDLITQSSLDENNKESDLLFKENINKDLVVLI